MLFNTGLYSQQFGKPMGILEIGCLASKNVTTDMYSQQNKVLVTVHTRYIIMICITLHLTGLKYYNKLIFYNKCIFACFKRIMKFK